MNGGRISNNTHKSYKIDMPITDAVYNILYQRISPVMEMRILADKLN